MEYVAFGDQSVLLGNCHLFLAFCISKMLGLIVPLKTNLTFYDDLDERMHNS